MGDSAELKIFGSLRPGVVLGSVGVSYQPKDTHVRYTLGYERDEMEPWAQCTKHLDKENVCVGPNNMDPVKYGAIALGVEAPPDEHGGRWFAAVKGITSGGLMVAGGYDVPVRSLLPASNIPKGFSLRGSLTLGQSSKMQDALEDRAPGGKLGGPQLGVVVEGRYETPNLLK